MEETLKNIGETVTFKKGERIITQGEKANFAYMILEGQVKVFVEDGTRKVELATLEAGQIFGETAILSADNDYSANIEANTDCTLAIITQDHLKSLIEGSDPIVRALLHMLMQRLKNTNDALIKSETREFMDIVLI